MLRWMLGAVVVPAPALIVQSLPDIARYRKMRAMSW
ncbi:MAG: DUF6893 family small protein [Thermomicrobiales bacterium]